MTSVGAWTAFHFNLRDTRRRRDGSLLSKIEGDRFQHSKTLRKTCNETRHGDIQRQNYCRYRLSSKRVAPFAASSTRNDFPLLFIDTHRRAGFSKSLLFETEPLSRKYFLSSFFLLFLFFFFCNLLFFFFTLFDETDHRVKQSCLEIATRRWIKLETWSWWEEDGKSEISERHFVIEWIGFLDVERFRGDHFRFFVSKRTFWEFSEILDVSAPFVIIVTILIEFLNSNLRWRLFFIIFVDFRIY